MKMQKHTMSFTKDKSFEFDVLGLNPGKLRENLNKFAAEDKAIENAKQTYYEYKNGDREKAISKIKLAQRYSDKDYPERFLTAVKMYKAADKIDEAREKLSGSKDYTIGVDYRDSLNMIMGVAYRKRMSLRPLSVNVDDVVMGARKWDGVYTPNKSYIFLSKNPNTFGFGWWEFEKGLKGSLSDRLKKVTAKYKSLGGTEEDAKYLFANLRYCKWFQSKYNDIAREKSDKEALKWGKATIKKHKIPENKQELLIKTSIKNAKVNEKKRAAKLKIITDIVTTVGKVALSVGKAIPGVGEAIKAAEKMVMEIPGVKEVLTVVDTVKSTVKQAKEIGDTVKLDKLKELGNNDKFRKALAVKNIVDKTVSDTIKNVNTAKEVVTKIDIVKAANQFGNDKIKTAMTMIKEAKEMNPEAIAKIKTIEALANNGSYDAQRAVQALRTANAIQIEARDEILKSQLQWVHW